MLCRKCGNQTEDGSKLCKVCRVKMKLAEQANMPKEEVVEEKSNPLIIILMVALAAVLALLLTIALQPKVRDADTVMYDYVEYLYSADAASLVDLFEEETLEYAMGVMGYSSTSEMVSTYQEYLDETMATLAETAGIEVDEILDYITVELGDMTGIDSEVYSEIYSYYSDNTGITLADGCTMALTLTLETDDYSEVLEANYYLVKLGDYWYLDVYYEFMFVT